MRSEHRARVTAVLAEVRGLGVEAAEADDIDTVNALELVGNSLERLLATPAQRSAELRQAMRAIESGDHYLFRAVAEALLALRWRDRIEHGEGSTGMEAAAGLESQS